MGDRSAIEWTDATWNPIRARQVGGGKRVGWHCVHVSEGCRHCYAETMNRRLGTGAAYKPAALGPEVKVFLDAETLLEPLRWKRPRKIFVGSMTDLFADFVPDEWIDQVLAVMALSPQHTFQVLTKRPERMCAYFAETWQPAPAHTVRLGAGEALEIPAEIRTGDRWDEINLAMDDLPLLDFDRVWTADGELIGRPAWPRRPLPNVWLGVSAEDQAALCRRWSALHGTPAAVRFLSLEPLLGPIDATDICNGHEFADALGGSRWHDTPLDHTPYSEATARVDWVIVGGESGHGARPMHPDWVRKIRDDCAAAGVAFSFKQWGEWIEVDDGLPPGQHRQIEVGDPEADSMVDAVNRPAWIARDGRVFKRPLDLPLEVPCRLINRVGKKAAGRLLDGRTHDGFPGSVTC